MVVLCNAEEERADEPGYVKSSFAGFDIMINEGNGFFNATKLCLSAKKHLKHFITTEKSKTLDKLLTNSYGTVSYTTKSTLVRDISSVSGTYYHPIMFLGLAMWCSNVFYMKAAFIVMDFFNRNVERRNQLKDLLKTDELDCDTCIINEFHKIQQIKYAGFNLMVNDLSWFNATKLCKSVGKSLPAFERYKNVDELFEFVKTLVNNDPFVVLDKLPRKDLAYGKYYHPILFLRLASWLSDEFYVKSSRIVLAWFSRDTDTLKQLASEELNSTTTPLTLWSSKPTISNTEEAHLVEATCQTTTECETSVLENRILELENQRQNIEAEKDELILQLQQKTLILKEQRVELRKRRLALKRLRKVEAKRPRLSDIERLVRLQGIRRVESVLVVRLDDERTLYAFRRQCNGLMRAVYNNRLQITQIVCWFLTDNAVQDFNSVKLAVQEVNAEYEKEKQATVTVTQNRIEICASERGGLDLAEVEEVVVGRLRESDAIEADVNLFRKYFVAGTVKYQSHSKLTLLNDIYRFVDESYINIAMRASEKRRRSGRNRRPK